MTVVTQFITSDGTANGDLIEIRRLWIQDGVVHQNSNTQLKGMSGNSLTDKFCAAQKTFYGGQNTFKAHGGMTAMDKAMSDGMVLSFSLWIDQGTYLNGGSCPTNTGDPKNQQPDATVTFSNIRIGNINTTYTGTKPTTTSKKHKSHRTSTKVSRAYVILLFPLLLLPPYYLHARSLR